ncbi:hypothetical protein ACFQU2_41005 [Siccirubricoccus deserti]
MKQISGAEAIVLVSVLKPEAMPDAVWNGGYFMAIAYRGEPGTLPPPMAGACWSPGSIRPSRRRASPRPASPSARRRPAGARPGNWRLPSACGPR